ncbi:MAG: T9SS type A sorting domain-containing protein [bacterium]
MIYIKKVNFLLTCVVVLSILPLFSYSQKSEWVEQVIVANGNQYEATPPFIDYVTVQTYDPSTGSTSVFDVIKTQSVQDVVIANQRIYVAAQDSIVMYDANTLQRLGSVADSGLSRLHVFNNRLIVSKQFPVVRFFVEVLNAEDLALIARIQNISGDCKGILDTKDSVYVAVNGGYLSSEGKLAVINFNTWTLSREINFGPNAVGISDLYNYGGVFFSVNETPYGNPDVGSVTAYSTYSLTYTNYILNLRVGNGSGLKNSGVIEPMLYLTLNNGIGSFNMETKQIADTTIFPDPGSVNHIYYTSYDADYVNDLLYTNVGNRISFGIDVVGTTLGDSVTSFITGFNTDAIGIDYRTPVNIDEPTSGEGYLALYPNPVENSLRVKYTGDAQVSEIAIMDITGRTIYKEFPGDIRKGTWINCSDFPSGLYFLTAKAGSKSLSAKFIKK